MSAPDGYAGPARLVQFVTGLTDAPMGASDLVGWVRGTTQPDSRNDAGGSVSRTAASYDKTVMGATTGDGGHLTGATAAAYIALQVGAATGTEALPAQVDNPQLITTRHSFFSVEAGPAGRTHVQVVTSLGATAPTITAAGGFTWTLLDQQQLADVWVSVWTAPITSEVTVRTQIDLSQMCDSGIGLTLSVPA